jgi:hypothetical protein
MSLSQNSHAGPQCPRRHLWRRRWVELVLGVALTSCVLLAVLAVYISRNVGPILRSRIVETLSSRFHAPVELDSVDVSLLRGVQVRGHGLRVLYIAGTNMPDAAQSAAAPFLLTVKDFAFRTSLRDLMHLRTHIENVEVNGMELHVPPHHGIRLQQTSKQQTPTLIIDRIHCKDARIVIETDKPGKEPLVFDINNLVLTNIAPKHPFRYTADLINPKPMGTIHAAGTFGPWQGAEPRSTPIDGEYSFTHADLSTIKGIYGTLSSTGQFSGQLGNIIIDGVTHTPDFALDISNHPLPLETQFHAVVDGTTGDTALNPVNAHLLHTNFSCTGLVARVPGKGHDISLEVKMPNGRIEDMLTLALKGHRPVMTAPVAMHAKLHIPPGPERVAQKIQLAGEVTEHGINFTNAKVQDEIDALSMRAQGRPKDAHDAGSDRKPQVVSTLTANFSYANELATFNSVQFSVPGAQVQLAGAFAVRGEQFDFKGHIRTDATASQMVTGWKSLLLKPVNPFLKKNGAGLQLPIEISGTKDDIHFGLALHGTEESPQSMAAEMRARRQSAHE